MIMPNHTFPYEGLGLIDIKLWEKTLVFFRIHQLF